MKLHAGRDRRKRMAHFQLMVIRQYPWGEPTLIGDSFPSPQAPSDTPSVSCLELSNIETLKRHTAETERIVRVLAQKPSDVLVK